MRLKLIGCEVLYREVCAAVARSVNQVDIEFLPKGLHDLGSIRMRARIQEAAEGIAVVESNALYGIGIEPLVRRIEKAAEAVPPLFLRGNPPIGTCTICVGKKEIGWQSHFGVVRALENQNFYRGE